LGLISDPSVATALQARLKVSRESAEVGAAVATAKLLAQHEELTKLRANLDATDQERALHTKQIEDLQAQVEAYTVAAGESRRILDVTRNEVRAKNEELRKAAIDVESLGVIGDPQVAVALQDRLGGSRESVEVGVVVATARMLEMRRKLYN
jgi:hypothetical protein